MVVNLKTAQALELTIPPVSSPPGNRVEPPRLATRPATPVGELDMTISRIETGARNPSIPLLRKLAKTLQVNLTDLLE